MRRPSLLRIAVSRLSWLNAAGVGVLWLLIFAISERWWLGTALTFFPRWPWAVPSVVLMLAGVVCARRYAVMNLVSAAIVLGPISQYQLQFDLTAAIPDGSMSLTVVTCNVQGYQQDFSQVVRELVRLAPDVIAFQEALPDDDLIQQQFGDWHVAHRGEFWVGSRYPVHLREDCWSKAFDRRTALCVAVDTPGGQVTLVNIHQMTARRSLNALKGDGIIRGTGSDQVERYAILRDDEARTTRNFVDHFTAGNPAIIVGDLNMPTSSCIYRAHWGDFNNAHDAAGRGYGYTSPCSKFWWWPLEAPWLRIDHILTSSHWTVSRCYTGKSAGSDHRLVYARLHLSPMRAP